MKWTPGLVVGATCIAAALALGIVHQVATRDGSVLRIVLSALATFALLAFLLRLRTGVPLFTPRARA